VLSSYDVISVHLPPDSGNSTVWRALTGQMHGYDVTGLGSEQASVPYF